MSPLSKGGKYFSRPADANRADALGSSTDDPKAQLGEMGEEEQPTSPAVSLHLFKTGTGFHSTSNHEDGSVQEKDHASFDEAADNGRSLFSSDEDEAGDPEEMGQEQEEQEY